MNNVICIEQARKRMRREPVAGAGKNSQKLNDRYQRDRIEKQFLLKPEPRSIGMREGVTTRQVLAIVRDALAKKEAA